MLLALSITFNCHYTRWGCMCSTGPFQFWWLKGYIYSSCYHHHHQIGSIHLSHCYHSFPWSCAWKVFLHHILSLIAFTFRENRDFVFIIIAQYLMSANSWIRFGLQIVFVCLYDTPPHCTAQFMGFVIGRIHYGRMVVFCFRHLLSPIIIIMQDCSQALNTCKCL